MTDGERVRRTIMGGAVGLIVAAVGVAGAQSGSSAAPDQGRGRPMAVEDFLALGAVSDPQVSPDGQRVMYAVRKADVAANKRTTATYVIPTAGGPAARFPDDTTPAAEARWSPDGRFVAFVAHDQLWVVTASGGGRRSLAALSGGASGPVWSRDASHIAFTSSVYPECADDLCNAAHAQAAEKNPVKAHIATHLMYRHWTAWDEGQRSHLFVVSTAGGQPVDVTWGARYDVPPGPFGGSEGYAWAPDGTELAYTAKDQGSAEAWTTDVNIYVVPAAGGPSTVITAANRAADQNPVYSPDGHYIAYAAQSRPGVESDRWRLMLFDRGSHEAHELLPRWDRNADGYQFTPDGRAMLIVTTDAGRDKIFRVPVSNGAAAGPPVVVVGEHNNAAPAVATSGAPLPRGARAPRAAATTMVWVRDAAHRPGEVYAAALTSTGLLVNVRQLTHVNDDRIAQLRLSPAEDFWFRRPDGDSVQGFIIKPPQWESGKRYPAVLLIHGGPQGAWLDSWHSRWNYQLFAAPGYGLIILNPRGSNGYGQAFVDGVSKDWGGRVYSDLLDGVDSALARAPWMDATRLGAAGGSFGGYMVNWVAGHTKRFKALVSHAGAFNLENMYGATEELWFPEWEYGGPFWDSSAMATQYRRYSPHLFASHFTTPTLVIHGELDYRVPYAEGLSMFTALQRQGVPSRLVVFPDEGHWIAKPQNQRLWWNEVQAWFRRYLSSADVRAANQPSGPRTGDRESATR